MSGYLFISFFFLLALFLSVRYFGELLDYVVERTSGRGVKNGSWKTHLGVGRKSTPKIEKAAIARIGLGANDSDETIYWNAFSDQDGDALHSNYEYKIIFKSEPPVEYNRKGFWSITVYGEDKFLVPNDLKKYVIRSVEGFEVSDDKPFEISLSRKRPMDYKYWLPLPQNEEPFSLAFRCYKAKDEMKKQAFQIDMPLIVRV